MGGTPRYHSRRGFLRGGLVLAGLGLLSGCGMLQSRAPQVGKTPRIGFLTPFSPEPSPEATAFREGLRELGYVPDQNLKLDFRFSAGAEGLAAGAAELVRAGVDLIVAANTLAGRAARQATETVPIVVAASGNPVGAGLVGSLGRPGGNVTGLTTLAPELSAKRLQLLKEIVPSAGRVAVARFVDDPDSDLAASQVQDAAQSLGLTILPIDHRDMAGAAAGLEALRGRVDAALLLWGRLFVPVDVIHRILTQQRLPSMFLDRSWVDVLRPELIRGLASYAPSHAALYRRAATYVDRILRGARPDELPVEQPIIFELVINLRTAATLGLTIPPTVLQQATELIQ